MTAIPAEDVIAVRPTRAPAGETVHRPFLITSLLFASLIGFILGIHVPLGRLLDSGSPEHTADLVQAHGQVQLLGFAGLFVIGMSLRLMPRFSSSRLGFTPLVLPTLYLLAAGLLCRALLMPWFSGDAHSVFLLVSVFMVLVGSGCFTLIAARTLLGEPRRADGSSVAFLLGALMLFAASSIGAVIAVDTVRSGDRTLPYLADNAIVLVQLFGFLLSFILAVALRAIPTMLGVERRSRWTGWLAILLATATLVLAGSLLWIEYFAYSRAAAGIAGLALASLGVVLLNIVWLSGATRQVANRIRPSSQASLWLLRSAIAWMLVAGLACVYFGVESALHAEVPAESTFDAVRHMLGVGVVTILITGMALMILPEVAIERQGATRQKQIAVALFLLLNSATLLRVLPSLASSYLTNNERNLSIAVAGSFAEVALLVFTVSIVRLMWRQRSA